MLCHTRSAVVLILVLAVSACAGGARRATLEYVERPVETIYTTAFDLLQKQRWHQAALQFQEVERQHPYSEWARRSMLMTAYALYRVRDYSEAVQAARAYISIFPGGGDAPYAFYLIGLSHFEQVIDVNRGQKSAHEALAAFTELIRRYPNSDYSRDAAFKIELVNNSLAGHAMTIGRYYMRRGNYLAAIQRFQSVIEDHGGTAQAPEALHRLVEINLALGLVGEARRAQTLLDYNFPDTRWAGLSQSVLAEFAPPAPGPQ